MWFKTCIGLPNLPGGVGQCEGSEGALLGALQVWRLLLAPHLPPPRARLVEAHPGLACSLCPSPNVAASQEAALTHLAAIHAKQVTWLGDFTCHLS